jgi:hypothetical protein
MSRLLTGWSGGACLVVTVHFRRALRGGGTTCTPLTCMFPSGCNAGNQSSAASSGNALGPTLLTHTRRLLKLAVACLGCCTLLGPELGHVFGSSALAGRWPAALLAAIREIAH